MRTPAQVKEARARLAFMREKREEREAFLARERIRLGLVKEKFLKELDQCDQAFDEANDPYIHRDQFNEKGRWQLIALISVISFIGFIYLLCPPTAAA